MALAVTAATRRQPGCSLVEERRASKYRAAAIARMAPALAARSIMASPKSLRRETLARFAHLGADRQNAPGRRDRRNEQERLQGRSTFLQIGEHRQFTCIYAES